MATLEMVIDNTEGLHRSINSRGSDEAKTMQS